MLEHLITGDFEPVVRQTPPTGFVRLDRADASSILNAQVETADWLQELGLTEERTTDELDRQHARKAFGALTTTTDEATQRDAVVALRTPEAVRHIVGMLTAYDWEFVEQAKQLRGFVVAKLVEHSGSTNANISLKALAQLGKVTEVGLFTEKVEVTKKDMSNEELDQRIKDKLAKFMGVVDSVDISDAKVLGPAEESVPPPAPFEDTDL